jgi:hypothetical protein
MYCVKIFAKKSYVYILNKLASFIKLVLGK